MTTPAPFGEDQDILSRLLADAGEQSQLRDVLVAFSAAPATGPQSGEAAAIAAFRELVAEPAGIPSLAHRRRLRIAAVAASSVVLVMSGGVAAAAEGALPGPAQDAAKSVLSVVGVHVPSSSNASGNGLGPRSGEPTPTETAPPGIIPPVLLPPSLPTPSNPTHPTHPSTPPTPGNSGQSRHHGNPTPTASGHPSPGHGKPSSPPVTTNRMSTHPSHSPSSQAAAHRAEQSLIHRARP